MTRFALWLLTGLLLALGVHVGTLLAVPYLAAKTPPGGLQPLGPDFVFVVAPVGLTAREDPALRLAICRYDLAEAPVQIRIQTTDSFTSVSVYTREGLNQYALNDRAAQRGMMEFTLYTPAQLADVRAREGPDTPEALRVGVNEPAGLVVVRALVPQPSEEPAVLAALAQATCEPVRR
jgi:uncharacterized membrane protein